MTTPASAPQPAPPVLERRRDRYTREIRLELAHWRTRTGGVYDLDRAAQELLLLPGHLSSYGPFLPDFAIVLGMGEPTADADGDIAWDDLRVHVGGLQWSYLTDIDTDARRPAPLKASAAAKWHDLETLLHGSHQEPPAPAWLVDLIATHTPWGALVRPTA